jgi:hypothetical protein
MALFRWLVKIITSNLLKDTYVAISCRDNRGYDTLLRPQFSNIVGYVIITEITLTSDMLVDLKVTQLILKCLLKVAIQKILTGCVNTQYCCDYKEPTQVISCYNPLAPVRQLPSNSRSVRMYFSSVQRVFIVKRYLTSGSYLTCQNECRTHFPIRLCQTNREYLVQWTVFATGTVPVGILC